MGIRLRELVLSGVVAAGLLGACVSSGGGVGFSARPTTPRLAPVDKNNLTPAQAAMLASRSDLNIYKTLAHHAELYVRWSPLGQVLLNNTNISARHREMAMLRMGWLCQAQYEWAQHARIAKASAGLTDADLRAIAVGASAPSWSAIDRAVLTMVDELRYDATISDATWTALGASYTEEQIMELFFTATQYQLVSMALNSLGVQDEPTVVDHLPTGLPMPKLAGRPGAPVKNARLAGVKAGKFTDQQKELLASRVGADGKVLNLYSTMVANPRLYEAWLAFMGYIFGDTGLKPRTREMLILRTGWLWNAEYEYAHHRPLGVRAGLTDAEVDRVAAGPKAAGWTEEEAAVLTAADELRREAFITDTTWATLSKTMTPNQIIELVYTVGGYGMTAVAIRTLGIETEPGLKGFPAAGGR